RAQDLVQALGGTWYGSYGTARCPAHDDRTPSLSIRQAQGRVVVHCHGGCAQAAVLAALTEQRLWHRSSTGQRCASTRSDSAISERVDQTERNRECAWRIWGEARPITGTLAERYLLKRRATEPETLLPPPLRFHPNVS